MATIDELLSNSNLKDDQELAIGEEKFTLGDLRKAEARRRQVVADKETALNNERSKVNKLAEDALNLWESMKNEPAPRKAAPKVEEDDEFQFDDPNMSKMGKALKKVMGQLSDQQSKYDKELESYKKALTEGFQYVVQDRYERQWDALADKPEGKNWNDYVKEAQDKKILDKWGLPDLVKAYQESTRGDREAKMKLAEFERGKEEGKKQAAPQMPRPGTSGPIKPNGKADKVYDSVDSLLEDAFGDADIAKLAGQVQ